MQSKKPSNEPPWLMPSPFQTASAGQVGFLPSPAAGSGLQAQDTPWPGWEGGGGQGSSSSRGGPQPQEPAGQAPRRKPGVAFPEEPAEAEQGLGQRVTGPVGSPPAVPHQPGKPPPPEHSGLAGEQAVGGGSAADDLIPPVEDSAMT